MDWVETTGRTVEEAKKAALEQLGVEEADADFEVISEPKLGLFGRLREEARVRARVQPRYPRAKADRRDRRRPRSAGHGEHPQDGQADSERQTEAASGAEPATAAAAAPAREASSSRARAKPAAASGEPASPQRRKRRAPAEVVAVTNNEQPASFGEMSVEAAQEQARLAEEFLRGLLSQIGAAADVSSHDLGEGIIEVEVNGEGLGTLIGPKGATLAAVQEITRTALQRHEALTGRVVIDINGYRKKREEALARFAQQVAEEVRTSGVKRALEAMPAADRKVVHDAVNDIAGVRTISEGEEPYRRVVLVPEGDEAGDGAVPSDASATS